MSETQQLDVDDCPYPTLHAYTKQAALAKVERTKKGANTYAAPCPKHLHWHVVVRGKEDG